MKPQRYDTKEKPCIICKKPYISKDGKGAAHRECWIAHVKTTNLKLTAGKTSAKVKETLQEAAVNKVQLAQAERELLDLRKRQSLKSIIGNQLAAAIREIPSLKTPPYREKHYDPSLDEEEFWCDFSDSQIGSKGDSVGTGGLATYSYEKFVERLARWKNAILAIAKYHPNKVRVLNIAFLGDLIEGSTIFESQARQIEPGGAAKQMVWGVEHICEAVNDLSAHFARVNCYGVVGNHGRVGKKGVQEIGDNLEWVMYHWMKDRLSSNPRIHWDIPEAYWMIVERLGHRHLLVHGDRGIRGWAGFPWYGTKRFKDGMRQLLKNTFDIEKDAFEYLHFGHFSNLVYFDDVFANGSFDAGTELSVTEMLSGGIAYQWMMALHAHYGVSWSRRIFLVDPLKKPRMPIYTGAK